jgi:outer membrane receptor protein involved in Fe transport
MSTIAYGTLATLAMPLAVNAQERANPDDIEEIYVTARKKQELVIEIPMNISVIGATEIAKRNLINKEDIFRTIAGGASPRGQLILRGLSGGNDSTPNTTTTFTDGIPFNFSNLYDVERVEVLRGPQGTLWGSNAIGGTVQVITKKPSMDELESSASIQMTAEANRPGLATRASGMVNFPISDTVAMRITASSAGREGKIYNTFTGTSGKETEHFIRAQLLWEPSDETRMNFSYVNTRDFSSTRTAADRSQPNYYYDPVLTPNPDADYGYDVSLTFPDCPTGSERTECRGGQLNGHDPKFSIWEIMDPFSKNTSNLFAVTLEKDNIIDGVDMVYAGSTRQNTYDGRQSGWSRLDAQDMFRTWIIDLDGNDRYTSELRFQNSGDGPLNWTVGAFFDKSVGLKTPNGQWQYHANDDKSRAVAAYLWGYWWGLGDPTAIGQTLYGDGNKNYNYTVHKWNTKEVAYFGEASYEMDVGDEGSLEFTAGIRYYDLKDDLHDEVSGIWIGDEAQETITKDGENGTRKKFSVNYMPNQNFGIFAIYSEGYRPGGNNGPAAPGACAADENIGSYTDRYESDGIKNYEVGFKGSVLDNQIKFSSAVYQIDWTGVQASVYMPSCGFSYTANAASAVSKGIEFESSTMLSGSLNFILNASYTDSKMTSDVPSLGAEDGDSMTMVPKYNLYAALDKELDMWGNEGSIRLDVSAYGETRSHFNTHDSDISPAYEVLSLSATMHVSENARLSLHVNNLLDTEYTLYQRTRSRSGASWASRSYFYGAERSLAVRLDMTF